MALTADRYLRGILAIGEWTALSDATPTNEFNADNVYTLTPWGTTDEQGARIVPSVQKADLRGGQSPSILDSQITEFGAQLEVGLVSAVLSNIQRLWGLPTSALTGDLSAGTPTAETLVVKGSELATRELQIYVRTMGPEGPRTYYFPRSRSADLAELVASRTDWVRPRATFDLYENSAGEMFWIVDAVA